MPTPPTLPILGADRNQLIVTGTDDSDQFLLEAISGAVLVQALGSDSISVSNIQDVSIVPAAGADTVRLGNLGTLVQRVDIDLILGAEADTDAVVYSGSDAADCANLFQRHHRLDDTRSRYRCRDRALAQHTCGPDRDRRGTTLEVADASANPQAITIDGDSVLLEEGTTILSAPSGNFNPDADGGD